MSINSTCTNFETFWYVLFAVNEEIHSFRS